jgi:hypothetical protein
MIAEPVVLFNEEKKEEDDECLNLDEFFGLKLYVNCPCG